MFVQKMIVKAGIVLVGATLLLATTSIVMADQVTLAYIGPDADMQKISVDSTSASDDLSKVAGLLGANGTSLSLDQNAGSGSLADIAKAMTEAAPLFAADIAQALVALDPEQEDAIVAAVNSVAGVDTAAVLAAVHFGEPVRVVVPPTDKGTGIGGNLPAIEQIPSKN